MRYGPHLSGACAHVGVVQVDEREGEGRAGVRAATSVAVVKVMRAVSAEAATGGRASGCVVRKERPTEHARAAACASVREPGISLPFVVQNLSCGDAMVADA